MAQGRVVCALLTLLVIMVLASVRPAWALTVTPNPAIAGVSFTISGTTKTGGSFWVFRDYGCPAGGPPPAFSTIITTSHYSVLVPGQPVGHYSAEAEGEDVCVNFDVDPAPVVVGGEMLPINKLQVLLPWLALVTLLATISVWTLVTKREDRYD